MPPALVQKAGAQSASNVASQAFTLPGAPTPGNLVLVGANSDATLTGPAGFLLAESSISGQGLYLWYRVAQSGDSATASVVPSVTDSVAGGILEYSGLTATPLDKTASGSASAGSTTVSTGTTGTTSQANELVIVLAGPHAGPSAFSLTSWTGGYTTQVSEGQGLGTFGTTVVGCFIGDLIVSAAGTYGSTATYTPAGDAGGLVATFLAAAGGHVITLGTATEADTAQVITPHKSSTTFDRMTAGAARSGWQTGTAHGGWQTGTPFAG